LSQKLVELDDSLLILIDVQDLFLARLPPEERRLLLNRILWTLKVATLLEVPVLATAEDVVNNGTVVPELAAALPVGTAVFDKLIFGLAGDERILAGVSQSGRKTLILSGLETDVCVAHSALGLLQLGYQVCVLSDATASPGSGHAIGLERMRRAGVLISSVKSVYYEWMRTVERDRQFRRKWPPEFVLPEGLSL
jgi:nicotinamidase-related amidase